MQLTPLFFLFSSETAEILATLTGEFTKMAIELTPTDKLFINESGPGRVPGVLLHQPGVRQSRSGLIEQAY